MFTCLFISFLCTPAQKMAGIVDHLQKWFYAPLTSYNILNWESGCFSSTLCILSCNQKPSIKQRKRMMETTERERVNRRFKYTHLKHTFVWSERECACAFLSPSSFSFLSLSLSSSLPLPQQTRNTHNKQERLLPWTSYNFGTYFPTN